MRTLSTGEIARLCDVSLRTVIRWIERGELKGHKLPGRGNNRVVAEDFVTFLQVHGMPVPVELASLGTRPILIIDDDETLAESLRRGLRVTHREVLVAHNGFQCGVMVESHKPELILLDLCMPGLNGFQVLDYLRESPENQSIKVVVISGMAEQERARAYACGADAVLSKPFDNTELLGVVGRLLESREFLQEGA